MNSCRCFHCEVDRNRKPIWIATKCVTSKDFGCHSSCDWKNGWKKWYWSPFYASSLERHEENFRKACVPSLIPWVDCSSVCDISEDRRGVSGPGYDISIFHPPLLPVAHTYGGSQVLLDHTLKDAISQTFPRFQARIVWKKLLKRSQYLEASHGTYFKSLHVQGSRSASYFHYSGLRLSA